jgi:lysophospholipase L1-like esterase
LIDYQRIADMGGAADLSVRPNGGSGETYWYGFNAKVSDAKLDVMSLAQPDVTAKWWVDRLTGGTTAVEDWGNAIPRALADGFDPDLVIIALGANDLDDPIIIDDVAVNLSTVVTEMRDICPNADVALQTYWQPTWSTVRDQVLAVADTAGTALLDFWPQIPPFSEHPALYADEFHLNAAGHQVLADLAVDALGIPVS